MDCIQISKQATTILSLIFGNDMYARSNVQVAIVVETSCHNNSFQKLSTSCVFTILLLLVVFLSCCTKFGTTYQFVTN